MKLRFALIFFWLIIIVSEIIVNIFTLWCILFNTKRAVEIELAFDRVGNSAMGQGNETISSWAGRHNSWMEPYINKLFEWLGEGPNHCDNNIEKTGDTNVRTI